MTKKCCMGFTLLATMVLLLSRPTYAEEVRHEIQFPNLPGYVTLKCDFHMHTMFSDGQVWPTVRVAETWRQGLDCIAITDHIEYQPHKDDVSTKHNRHFEIAVPSAATHSLLLVRGAEITRDTPPGHFNAIFTSDNEPLQTEDFLEAIKRANEQGAFVFWNHHAWQGAEKGKWLDVHTTMFQNKWLHGMEVCNGETYYPEAHQWCLEKNLTMLGNTDIHEPDLRTQSTSGDHRAMTLVFAKERTLASIKEALIAGRTAVWSKDRIIGRQEFLEPLFAGCVQVLPEQARQAKAMWVQLRNDCDADIALSRSGDLGPAQLTLHAKTVSLVKIDIAETTDPVQLKYTAKNFLIGPNAGMPVILTVPGSAGK